MGWYHPSDCFCNSTAPRPLPEASVSNRKGLPKSGKARMGAWRHAALRRSKALRAFSGKSRCSDFPTGQVIQGSCDVGKPLNELPVVTNESNKRLDLGISIRRWALSDSLQILLGGEYPLFTYMVSQVVNLRPEHLTFGWF